MGIYSTIAFRDAYSFRVLRVTASEDDYMYPSDDVVYRRPDSDDLAKKHLGIAWILTLLSSHDGPPRLVARVSRISAHNGQKIQKKKKSESSPRKAREKKHPSTIQFAIDLLEVNRI